MKFNYDHESDAMLIQLEKKGKIDYAEQAENFIVHFTKDSRPVLLEILDASEFLLKGLQSTFKLQSHHKALLTKTKV